MFPGKPIAVLTCMVYGRQILEQNLNLISDYKFGFYMKIPEREMFIGQVYGTLLGPFINYGMMRESSSIFLHSASTDITQDTSSIRKLSSSQAQSSPRHGTRF